MGNFAFDQEYPETYPSFILNSKVNETGFYEFTLTPVYIDDYIPHRAEGGLGLHILDDLAQRSKDLDTYLKIDRDSIIARVIMDTASMTSTFTENTVELPMEETGNSWTTPPHPLARMGSISSVDSIEPNGNYEFRLGRELIWFGNMENEGCTLWNLNSADENYCDSASVFRRTLYSAFKNFQFYFQHYYKFRGTDHLSFRYDQLFTLWLYKNSKWC